MKAARLYEYDEQMNVDLKVEQVDEPKMTAPDAVIVRIGAAGL
jgi:NAD+-dependent secondary alcohol dehydrogenase Adh1